MKIHFQDIFCESCAPANYKTPNDCVKVNLLLLCEGLLNFYIILKPDLFCEIAVLYTRA